MVRSKSRLKAFFQLLYFSPGFLIALIQTLDNYSQVQYAYSIAIIYRTLAVLFVANIVLAILFKKVFKDIQKASLVLFLTNVFFFSYLPISNLISKTGISLHPTAVSIVSVATGLIILLVIAFICLRIKNLSFINLIMAIALTGFLGYVAYGLIHFAQVQKNLVAERQKLIDQELDQMGFNQNAKKPDIYFVVFDGYVRHDVAQELYGFDNPLEDNLKEKGFVVFDKSRSNYDQTLLSLSSNLNLDYLDVIYKSRGKKTDEVDRNLEIDAILNSKVENLLKSFGYKTANVRSYTWGTDSFNDDYVYSRPQELNQFEVLLFRDTMLRPYFEFVPQGGSFFKGDRQVARVEYSLKSIPKMADIAEPTFTFAHIMSPHPPFVFDSTGLKNQDVLMELVDGSRNADYILQYKEQVLGLNQRIEKMTDEILAKYKGEEVQPIIIYQSDHGPSSTFDWRDTTYSDLPYHERMSILNAIYLPENLRKDLDQNSDISSVNTYRFLFNKVFSANYPILPNKILWSDWDDPLNFTDVTKSTQR